MKKVKTGLWLVVLISYLILSPNRMAFAQGEDGSSPDMHITQVDTSQFPLVTVYLSVTDSNGEPLGIDPARLRLPEGLQLQFADGANLFWREIQLRSQFLNGVIPFFEDVRGRNDDFRIGGAGNFGILIRIIQRV